MQYDFESGSMFPKKGTEYYYIDKKINYIGKSKWTGSLADIARYYDCNIYETEEECRQKLLSQGGIV